MITGQDMYMQMRDKISKDLKIHFYGIEYPFNGPGSTHQIIEKKLLFFMRQVVGFLNMFVTDQHTIPGYKLIQRQT